MEFPIKFDKVKSGWFIVYIEGSLNPNQKFDYDMMTGYNFQNTFFSLKIDFVIIIQCRP